MLLQKAFIFKFVQYYICEYFACFNLESLWLKGIVSFAEGGSKSLARKVQVRRPAKSSALKSLAKLHWAKDLVRISWETGV